MIGLRIDAVGILCGTSDKGLLHTHTHTDQTSCTYTRCHAHTSKALTGVRHTCTEHVAQSRASHNKYEVLFQYEFATLHLTVFM